MDEEDIRPGYIVFLRHGFFPDTNMIDYRVNGRPYLIYNVQGDNVLLLKMSKSNYFGDPFYYQIKRKNSRNKEIESYVDVRYLIVVKMDKLLVEYNALLVSIFKKRVPKKMEDISKQDFNNIIDLRNKMEMIEEFKTPYPLYPNVPNDGCTNKMIR